MEATEEACVLFADISGSTALYESLGDSVAEKVIALALGALERTAKAHSGSTIKTIGDELMLRFDSAEAAALAAVEMQQLMKNEPPAPGIPLQISVGFHHGPVVVRDGDLFGDAVNIAARMTQLAKAQQILMTQETFESLSADTQRDARAYDKLKVKGKATEIAIFELTWGATDLTRLIESPDIHKLPERLHLTFAWQSEGRTLTGAELPCMMGRDESCDITVPSNFASRRHAQFEFRRGKFVLVDQSANGTYVTFSLDGGKGESVYLRGEGLPLIGSGTICLGKAPDDDASTHCIRYRCD